MFRHNKCILFATLLIQVSVCMDRVVPSVSSLFMGRQGIRQTLKSNKKHSSKFEKPSKVDESFRDFNKVMSTGLGNPIKKHAFSPLEEAVKTLRGTEYGDIETEIKNIYQLDKNEAKQIKEVQLKQADIMNNCTKTVKLDITKTEKDIAGANSVDKKANPLFHGLNQELKESVKQANLKAFVVLQKDFREMLRGYKAWLIQQNDVGKAVVSLEAKMNKDGEIIGIDEKTLDYIMIILEVVGEACYKKMKTAHSGSRWENYCSLYEIGRLGHKYLIKDLCQGREKMEAETEAVFEKYFTIFQDWVLTTYVMVDNDTESDNGGSDTQSDQGPGSDVSS